MAETLPVPLRSALLADVTHGFFTRQGGVSQGIFASLNLGVRNADAASSVSQNIARVAAALKVSPEKLVVARQVHGDRCVEAGAWPFAQEVEADAVASSDPERAVGALAADCVPVLLAGPDGQSVAAVHAGWRSALGGIIVSTVERLTAMGAPSTQLRAAIGPAIQLESYEVGAEFKTEFTTKDPPSAGYFRDGPKGKPHFDLPGYVELQLQRAGVGQIDNLRIDTVSDEVRFFSNRRAYQRGEPGFGLQISAIRPNG